MIIETYRLDATNTDVLAAPSRLSAIPYNGTLIFEMQGQNNDGTNYFDCTLQLPDGSTPFENLNPPDGATDGAINADDKFTVAFPAQQGGHFLFSATENGTAVMLLRVTLTP